MKTPRSLQARRDVEDAINLSQLTPVEKAALHDRIAALVEALCAETTEWRQRAVQHGCDVVNGDPDCG